MKILLLFLFFTASVVAQEIAVKPGLIVDSIPVNDSLNNTFSLYVPTSFDGTKEFPVIFVFDGKGRGKSGAHYFKSMAEEQDYFLISSNAVVATNTLEENVRAALLLIEAVQQRLPLNRNYISLAGFAEGARVVSVIPSIIRNIHGIIYIGDHNFNFEMLSQASDFTAIGIVGDRQAELLKMEFAAGIMEKLGFNSQLYTFNGEKDWPDNNLVQAAVGALTLEAIKSKKRPKDPELISKLYKEGLVRANNRLRSGEYLAALETYTGMENRFSGLIDISEVKNGIRQLKRSDGLKSEVENKNALDRKRKRLLADFNYYLEEDILTANFENLGWWNYQRQELLKLMKGEDKAEAAMGAQMLQWLKEMTKDAIRFQEEGDAPLESKLIANMLVTIFDSHNFEAYKSVISLSARDQDFQTALFYLEEMLKNGYTDSEALYNIESTLGLKTSKEFNWLIKKYLGTSKYYDNATSLY